MPTSSAACAEPSMNRHMSSTDVVPPRTASVYAMYDAARAISGVSARCAGSTWFSSHSQSAIDSAVPRSRPGVQVAVVEPGEHGVHRRVDRRHGGGGRVLGHLVRSTDGGDDAVDHEHRARVVNGPPAVHRQDDPVVDQHTARLRGHVQQHGRAWRCPLPNHPPPPRLGHPRPRPTRKAVTKALNGCTRIATPRLGHPRPRPTRKAVTKALNGCTRIATPRLGHVRPRPTRKAVTKAALGRGEVAGCLTEATGVW